MPAWMSVRLTVGVWLGGVLGVGWSMPGWVESQRFSQPSMRGCG